MKVRIRENHDPIFPNTVFYYVEKKFLWFWYTVRQGADKDIAFKIYQDIVDGKDKERNIIIAKYP